MKQIGKISLFLLVFVLVAGLVACGSSNSGGDNSGSSSATEASGTDTAAAADTNAAPAETQSEVIPTPDPKLGDDSILGNWTDVNDSTRFAKITKDGSNYFYEDNESKYPGEFKDGVLKIKVSDTANDTAEVYFDAASGNLYSVYQGTPSKFTKSK